MRHCGDWPLGSAPVGSQVVRTSGLQAGPLGDGASARPHWLPSGRAAAGSRVGTLLWPAGGRVLPLLLSSVHSEVHERVAVVHCLDAAEGRPVGFEDAVAVEDREGDVARMQLGRCRT